MAINDVWKNSYSENTSQKVWAAKYVARHPNLVALELSSFKCGHDAPIYTVVEEIVEHSGTPVLLLQGYRREQAHGLDQDPRGDHRLLPEALPRRHGRNKRKQTEIDVKLAELEAQLRAEYGMSQTAASSPVEDREAESALQAV